MITDLWFVSDASLDVIAEGLGLRDVNADIENHWEWVIGTLAEFPDTLLDITRTHTVPAGETTTRIFIWAGPPIRELSADLVELLATRLRAMGIAPVHAGRWIYRRGNEFDLVVERTIA
ncbi:MAG: hypothetical protein JNL83_34470 [Myxococcales bacterium]|nr:hypothetical protein [Myxococcales bacterium]